MNKKLSIVLYTQGLPFSGDSLEKQPLGGAETAVIYLCRELSNAGHNVNAFCNCPRPGTYHGVFYQDVTKFQTWIYQGSCDLFVCSRYYDVFRFIIPAKVKILWLHDHLLKANALEVSKVLPAIDFIYCVSNYHAAYTAQFFSEQQHKIKITHNGVDLELVQSVTKDITSKKHRIMYTSRPERGLTEALYVYERLGDKSLEFIACTYPYPNEETDKTLLRQIAELTQKGFNIRFEHFNKQDLYRNIAESKAVIYPANTPEIFCISAVEAQACKTVFLGRQLGALAETVAYPCQNNSNPEQFFQITKNLLEDEQGRKAMEERGWQHIQKYTWQKVAEKFIEDATALLNNEMDSLSTYNFPLLTSGYQENWSTLFQNGIPPKITCLINMEGSIIHIKRSITCFLEQSYPNKELIILNAENQLDPSIKSYLAHLDDIRIITPSSLDHEELIKLIFDQQQDGYLCWWNAQSLYHPERLFYQYKFLEESGLQGCVLNDHLEIDKSGTYLYWITNHDSLEQVKNGWTMFVNKKACLPRLVKNIPVEKWNETIFGSVKMKRIYHLGYICLRRNKDDRNNLNRQGWQAEYMIKRKAFLENQLLFFSLKQPLRIMAKNDNIISIYKRG